MPTIKNSGDTQAVVRVGKGSADYIFYFIPPHGQIRVSMDEARTIQARIEEVKKVDKSAYDSVVVLGLKSRKLSEG